MSVTGEELRPGQGPDVEPSDRPGRLPWRAPRLRRIDALDAQAKTHPGVEGLSRHLTS